MTLKVIDGSGKTRKEWIEIKVNKVKEDRSLLGKNKVRSGKDRLRER